MSVITFWNNENTETGKTMSVIAIATYMAIEHNARTLVVSTTNKNDRMKTCFWKEEKKKKRNLGIFGPNTNIIDAESGAKGLEKIIRSNKITPGIITNYTKVIFKDRLEILLGEETSANSSDVEKAENMRLMQSYPDIISAAAQYYDRILIDLDYNIPLEIRQRILQMSDVIILGITQRLSSIENLRKNKENNPLLKSPKTLLLVGRYDKFSKYNSKNITRYLGEKNQILTIPYNTLFFEATEEAGVPDLFLSFKKFGDQEDRNAFFIAEVKRATDNIIYRLQEIQAGLK